MPHILPRNTGDRVRSALSAVLSGVLVAQLVFAAIPAPSFAETPGDYAYWFGYAQTRIYPGTTPGADARMASAGTGGGIALGAAQAEFEGRQIAIRPSASGLHDIWIAPTDLTRAGGGTISAGNVSTFKVSYVNITEPSYNVRGGGLQPDPLLPMTLANGQRLGWAPSGGAPDLSRRGVAANTTQPFYVLFKVPADAAPGVYTGTLAVSATDDAGRPAPALAIPVALTVYPFSVAQHTLQTSFGLNLHRAALANSAAQDWLQPPNPNPGPNAARVAESSTHNADQVGGWLKYMADHRISPQTMHPAWVNQTGGWAPPTDSGDMVARQDVLADYLGTGSATTFSGERYNFDSVKMPEVGNAPWIVNPFKSGSYTALAMRYYATMKAQLGAYFGKAYAYPVDEPRPNKRKFVEKYAALIHRAAPGTRVLLTTDPTTQNGKLVKGVDIYVSKIHFVFRDSAWTKKIRKARKELWIYSHSTNWQIQTPGYLIDEPVTDSRSQGWFVYRTRATGLLYFNICNWQISTPGGVVQRDPYTRPNGQTKTYKGHRFAANGDGSLVYPGYYPALGLYVEGSPPVGSLRMEALRDGLEDYEYLKLVAGRYGTPMADAYCGRIIGKLPKPKGGKLLFPKWAQAPESYEQVRAEMAGLLSR